MNIGSAPAVVVTVLLSTLLGFFLYLIVGVARVEVSDSNVDGKAVASCIEKFTPVLKIVNGTEDLYHLNGFCTDSLGSQLLIDQEKIRRDNFLFQRNENVILLYMVVLITLSGVTLAGAQLFASYKLAVMGRGELSGGGTIDYSVRGVSFKSSVVGLTILAMSFGFFLVFVIYVYTLKDISSSGGGSLQSNFQIPPSGGSRAVLFPATPGAVANSNTQPQIPPDVASPGYPNTIDPLRPDGASPASAGHSSRAKVSHPITSSAPPGPPSSGKK